MTPLQSIAKSIYEARSGRGCVPWGKLARTHQEPYLGDAKAALGAMREPSEVMCAAGMDDTLGGVGLMFSAMVDAALKEG